MSDKTELPKEWHELAQRESVVLNPSNENNQEVYRLAFTDGLNYYHDAVEKMLKDKETEVNKDFVFTDEDEYRQLGKLSLVEELLFDLKNITPND
jgi:hypothetical protein